MNANQTPKPFAASRLTAILVLGALASMPAPTTAQDLSEPPVVVYCYLVLDNPWIQDQYPSLQVSHLPQNLDLCNWFHNEFELVWDLGAGIIYEDGDGDRMGDAWEAEYQVYDAATDHDGDDLSNVDEFNWLSDPMDIDTDNDLWNDNVEAAYWRSYVQEVPYSDDLLAKIGLTTPGQGANLDTDGDGTPNMRDPDSDNDDLLDGEEGAYLAQAAKADTDGDGLLDGVEVRTHGTRAYEADSDADSFGDREEVDYWISKGVTPSTADSDGDGKRNVLDSDSDNDGLGDGAEVNVHRTDPARNDTDADGMPDKWEVDNQLAPTVNDAALDPDGDALPNLGEYQAGTMPHDMDTENDLLLDGEEVLTYHTNPRHFDTDDDTMPDRYEVLNGLNPSNATDKTLDLDGDSYNRGNDGTIELSWPNWQEYRYGRPAGYSEVASGPWLQGTKANDPDSDDDGAQDGNEVYYGTNPNLPADGNSDEDQDGLNFTLEVKRQTDPDDPDTDGDGLCDGGRAANCTFQGFATGNQPGESDYGSNPWETDTDNDTIPDGQEAFLWDPAASGKALDIDSDLANGVLDYDSDNDGLTDGEERAEGTDMRVTDTDGDRLLDGDEVHYHETNPNVRDSDLDGLNDGDEVEVHHSKPSVFDTDGDGLGDGLEVSLGTSPLLVDSDQDTVPDGWEVAKGTQPLVADADQDVDADDLTSGAEYLIATHPRVADTDGDGMPDGYEHNYDLNPRSNTDRLSDPDFDGLGNLGEYGNRTDPHSRDTDADAAVDGWEVKTGKTDPLNPDTDADGFDDGLEYNAWAAKSYPWNQDADGDTLDGLHDPDSDNDGLTDREELVDSKSKPHVADSDGDGLSDFDEVVTYGGRFSPNDPDSDHDGLGDKTEAAILADKTGDYDGDGFNNGDEGTYGTDPTKEDSDCDGVTDGAEFHYWGSTWNTGGNRMMRADVDQDTLKDGVEIGTVGTPSQVMYRTNPEVADTDGDGLRDDAEARNNVRVACGTTTTTSSSSMSTLPSTASVVQTAANGLRYVSGVGGYVLGGYGVKLLPDGVSLAQLLASSASAGTPAAGTNGRMTDPTLPDTDADGLNDYEELQGSRNPYKSQRYQSTRPGGNTDPLNPDTDADGIKDGREVGAGIITGAWIINPNVRDTDADGRDDGLEDSNRDGKSELSYNPYTASIRQTSPGTQASSPTDADTDDDGINDLVETLQGSRSRVLEWDSDFDGLSDGLETGVTSPVIVNGITYTVQGKNVLGLSNWPTYQKWLGTTDSTGQKVTSTVDLRDSDNDGIIDGLEDLNHNGKFGDLSESRANVGDSDNDGLNDGRELLVYGTYTFQTFVAARGNPANAMAYDGHAFKTNPMLASTDRHLPGGDLIPDGKDINPKGDGLLFLKLEKFWQKTTIDVNGCCTGSYETDLQMGITMETGIGDFTLTTNTLQDFGRKNGATILGHGLYVATESRPTSMTGTAMATTRMVQGVDDTIKFDLSDNFDDFVKTRDLKVHVRLDAIDKDQSYNDVLDVSPSEGQKQFYDTRGVDLAAGPLSGGQRVFLDANGEVSNNKWHKDDDDARLTMYVNSNLVPYFLRNLMGTQILGGTCLAGVDELNRPCLR